MSSNAPGQPTLPTTTARKLLVDWANAQDGWVRELALEVLAAGKPASDEAVADVYSTFLAEKGLAIEPPTTVPPLEYEEKLDPGFGEFVFRKLEGVQGVNALSAGQTIEFSPKLTILFGENGAGKTGYARVLKRLADVRTAEEILPNVHEPGAARQQSAKVTYSVSGDEHVLNWEGETGVPPMTHVSVFDSPAMRLHVDDDLAYVYTPRDLALFGAVSEGIEAVRARAEEDVAARRPGTNPYLSHFSRSTTAYTLVETLGPATDVAALRALATITEEQEAQIDALRTSVSALQSSSLQAQLASTRDRLQLYTALTNAAGAIAAFDAEAYNQSVATAKAAEEAYAALRAELLSSSGISGASDEAWQDFVLRGETYREHLQLHGYPREGDSCLYCRQPLDVDAAGLLRQYRHFATDASRHRIEDARATAQMLIRNVAGLDRAALAAAVKRHRADDEDDEVLAVTDALLAALSQQAERWEVGETVDWSGLSDAASVETESEARRAAADLLVTDLTARSQDRLTRLQQDAVKLAELEGRRELKKRIEELESFVAAAKWVQLLEQLLKRFPALLRSLTEVAKTASEQLLNADFEQRFAEECKVLRAPDVRLEFPGRRGQPARRKVVSAAQRPSQVLSEGEQKVIALADFLAEAALRLIPAPVIFDDPVNSLDYRRILEVAARIARLAEDRQVIVFTHSIWLATQLLAHFDKKDQCSYYSVTDEGGKGVVVAGAHPRWDTPKSIAKTINGLVASAKTAEGDAREAIVEKAYSWLRSWCEVVVEQELLKGVTRRFEANVRMTVLPQIRGERLGPATAVITPVFDKACRIMEGHSQPLETLSVRPSLQDFEKEWAEVQQARTAYLA